MLRLLLPGSNLAGAEAWCAQRVNVLQFRRELEVSTEDNAVITYAELLDKCQARCGNHLLACLTTGSHALHCRQCVHACSGAAASRQEAEVVCKALLAASVVMRLGDLVYLRPYDVAELIAQVCSHCGRFWAHSVPQNPLQLS